MVPAIRIPIYFKSNVEEARRQTRSFMKALGATDIECESVVLAVSELATNLMRYADNGIIRLSSLSDDERRGVCVESLDDGPGISDVEHAMQDGWSTSGSLGSGLPAVGRLMDDLNIRTDRTGTVIVAHKWLTR